jgi:diguanylate cyclase (GGDEF)-like protein
MTRLRANPTLQISLALAVMAGVLVLVASVLLDRSVDGVDERTRARRMVAEAVAMQAATLVRAGDPQAVRSALRGAATRDPTIVSIALRREDGTLYAHAGDPPAEVSDPAAPAASPDRVRVTLQAGERRWGHLEIVHRPVFGGVLGRWLNLPMMTVAAFVFAAGLLGFWLFMRRVLQHLDPSSVIPERVRSAFDSLSDGVAIVDRTGQVVLTNRSLRELSGEGALRSGTPLAALRWRTTVVAGGASREVRPTELPWIRAMHAGEPIARVPLRLQRADGERDLQVSCSPIRDGHGAVQGCLVSMADLTAVVRTNARLRSALAELQASREEIESKNRALETLAMIDPLSGCLNRRAFTKSAVRVFARAAGGGAPASVLIADLDHFKSINDRFGHAVGDEVIRTLAEVLRETSREGDLAARWGGEEFVMMLASCDADAAFSVAQRIRLRLTAVSAERLGARHPDLKVTVSLGVAPVGTASPTLEALIEQADVALYHAKRSGRDRVCRHDRLSPAAEPNLPAASAGANPARAGADEPGRPVSA